MSSRSDPFECRWQRSRQLVTLYVSCVLLVCSTLLWVWPPAWVSLTVLAGAIAHMKWVLPRAVLLAHPAAVRGLRHDASGWAVWSDADGWAPVQLRPDSLALPFLIVLRYRPADRRFVTRSVCIPADALPRATHRRLRVRLKFSRRRWAAPE
ncbi:protein YgfX [Stutzerimonas urumqiensis]|uniref:protein YgfX n=1 Tax=Stutzerimonas urumqiensis TaxID=638269 RepID=UPI003DA1F398